MLPPATIELGMGAHGEPGLQRITPIPAPKDLVKQMITLLTDTDDSDRAFIPFTKDSDDSLVVLLLNSLGSTSDEVLARFAELGIQELQSQGFRVERLTLGPLVTSLKMSGFGFTLWRLPSGTGEETLRRDEALRLWDESVGCVAWRQ